MISSGTSQGGPDGPRHAPTLHDSPGVLAQASNFAKVSPCPEWLPGMSGGRKRLRASGGVPGARSPERGHRGPARGRPAPSGHAFNLRGNGFSIGFFTIGLPRRYACGLGCVLERRYACNVVANEKHYGSRSIRLVRRQILAVNTWDDVASVSRAQTIATSQAYRAPQNGPLGAAQIDPLGCPYTLTVLEPYSLTL